MRLISSWSEVSCPRVFQKSLQDNVFRLQMLKDYPAEKSLFIQWITKFSFPLGRIFLSQGSTQKAYSEEKEDESGVFNSTIETIIFNTQKWTKSQVTHSPHNQLLIQQSNLLISAAISSGFTKSFHFPKTLHSFFLPKQYLPNKSNWCLLFRIAWIRKKFLYVDMDP